MPAPEKRARLDAMAEALTGSGDAGAGTPARVLRRELETLGVTSRHGLDLLDAFRQDVTKSRYGDWDELMAYCRLSAAPVGRFVLDLHGEGRATWPASDALCCALQVINHLQDCGTDFRVLDRVYMPLDALAAAGVDVDALGAPRAAPALRQVITGLAARVDGLLREARPLASLVRDPRLGLEIGAIQGLAESLARRLARHDPLAERVRHHRAEAAAIGLAGAVRAACHRLRRGTRSDAGAAAR